MSDSATIRRFRARIGVGIAAVPLAVVTAFAEPAAAQERTRGLLVSPHVVCRLEPSRSASVAGVLMQTGDVGREIVLVGDSATDATGEVWVFVARRQPRYGRCWVPEAVVVPDSGTDPLLAMADRLLSAPDGHSLADWVAALNYFVHPRYRPTVDESAILTLRRLEVLMRALRLAQSGQNETDPLVVAWLESLGGEVEYSAGQRGRERWVVSREALDALYDAHREDPVAEEILWKSARYYPSDPDECWQDVRCLFDRPLQGVARYWLAHPDGAFVRDAVRTALGQIRGGLSGSFGRDGILGTCEDARDAEPGSWQVDVWNRLEWENQGVAAARRLLATLNEVGEEDKAPLVDYLDTVERCAIEVGARNPRPESPETEADQEDPGPPAETRELAIIASGVACRSRPSRTARAWWTLDLDYHFSTERPDTSVAGEAWVSVRGRDCWVDGSHTAPAGTDEHVLAIADRFLTSGEGRTLDGTLRVYNVLAGRHGGHREDVDASAVLTLKRLQVLGVALRGFSPYSADALMRGWAGQLEGEVWLWSIGAAWYVRDEAFMNAYEKHRESPGAEEILWEMAIGPSPHDCEGEFACTVRVAVSEKLARYWAEFPRGRHVRRAVEIATARLDEFLETCNAARGAEPDSREARWWEWVYWEPRGAEVAREIRATLNEVGQRDKAPLAELLDGLEACAADVGG